MGVTISRLILAAAICFCFAATGLAGEKKGSTVMADVTGLAATRLDTLRNQAAASLPDLAKAYTDALAATGDPGKAEIDAWLAGSRHKGSLVGLKTYPGTGEPGYQSGFPAIYSYAGPDVPAANWRELAAMSRMFADLRRIHDELELSWVYLTTESDSFLIYPFLPIAEAMANDKPSAQVYYKAADVAGRAVGWTEPYLDLVGAGMMVTASYPVFDGGKLAGVVSRDITLRQIAAGLERVLPSGAAVLVVDKSGLAVAASGAYGAEIDAAGAQCGKACLFFRDKPPDKEGRVSSQGWLNACGQAALDKGANLPSGGRTSFVVKHERARYQVSLARPSAPGWLVVGVEKI